MASRTNPRHKYKHRRDAIRSRVAAQGLPCAICGLPIDYTLPPLLPGSFELDEIIPVSRGGDPYSLDNVQPTHRICNQRKRARILTGDFNGAYYGSGFGGSSGAFLPGNEQKLNSNSNFDEKLSEIANFEDFSSENSKIETSQNW